MDCTEPPPRVRSDEDGAPRPGGHAADRRRQFVEERGLSDRPRALDLDRADRPDGDEDSSTPAAPTGDEH